jgi:hypothetical protein
MRRFVLIKENTWFICRDKLHIAEDVWFCRNDASQAPMVCEAWGIPQYIIKQALGA